MDQLLSGVFGAACSIDIGLEADKSRKTAPLCRERKTERALIYTDGEDVEGFASVQIRPGKKLEHQGMGFFFECFLDFFYRDIF